MPNVRGASPVAEFGDDHGVIHEAVVTGKKVGAGRQFWATLAENESLFGEVVAFVDAKCGNIAPTSATVSLTRARKILGSRNVFSGVRVAKAWDVELGKDLPVRYSEADLIEAARENTAGTADWRLVRVLGLWSQRDLHDRFGVDQKSQPCFYKAATWWLGASEDSWATAKPAPSYYLLDFKGKWGATKWDVQNAQTGSDYERADEAAVAEAAFTIFLLTKERLMECWCHWGRSETSGGHRVCVGYFDSLGWFVSWYRPANGDDGGLRVVRSRKFRS